MSNLIKEETDFLNIQKIRKNIVIWNKFPSNIQEIFFEIIAMQDLTKGL